MILDTSAVLAILFEEPEAPHFAYIIGDAESCTISAATFVEISIIVEARKGDAGIRMWELFFREAGIAVEAITEEHARTASRAWSKFGKGRHSAGLNFGDCFSYALAKIADEPLLFKGDDFARTDITPAS
jgi:ribonuclease VapC